MLIHKFRAKRLFSPYFQHFKKVIDSKCFRKTKRNLFFFQTFFLPNINPHSNLWIKNEV